MEGGGRCDSRRLLIGLQRTGREGTMQAQNQCQCVTVSVSVSVSVVVAVAAIGTACWSQRMADSSVCESSGGVCRWSGASTVTVTVAAAQLCQQECRCSAVVMFVSCVGVGEMDGAADESTAG